MPQGVPRPDHLPPGPHRELAQALYDLYSAAGRPSTRAISDGIRARNDLRDTVSHESVSAMLKGVGVPKWIKLECAVIYLASIAVDQPDRVDVLRKFLELWQRANDASTPDRNLLSTEVSPQGQLLDRPQRVVSPQKGQSHAALEARPGSEVPPRNRYFTGRSRLLRTIDELFTAGEPMTAITGLGGTGKTQLAIEYLYLYRENYDLVWWAPSETSGSLRDSLSALGTTLSLPASIEMRHPAAQVLAALGEAKFRWLLVLDNAASPRSLPEINSYGSGHVLVTSRDPDWVDARLVIELDVFDRPESVELFRKRGVTAREEDMKKLADRLGDLPLAVDQVATWSASSGIDINDLLADAESNEQTIGLRRSKSYIKGIPRPLGAILNYAFKDLNDTAPAAMELFELFAFLGSEPIALNLLLAGARSRVTLPLQSALRDKTSIDDPVGELRRHGLLRVSGASQTEPEKIQTHRLFREHLRNSLSADRLARAKSNVHAILAAANPRTPDDPRSWDRYRELGAHVDAAELTSSADLAVLGVALDQVRYLYRIGHYEESLQLGARLVSASGERARDQLSKEFFILAGNHLANAMRMVGRYSEAKHLTLDGIAHLEQGALDHEFEYLAVLETNRAYDLRLAGEYSAALDVDQENLERLERMSSMVDGRVPDTILDARNNIAVDYRLLGQYQEAYRRDLDLVRLWEENYGENEDRTLYARTNLARDLYGLGRFREALATTLAALTPYRDIVGSRHYGVLLASRTEAICRRQVGDPKQAVQILEKNCSELATWFSAGHEYTLSANISLVNALRSTGRLRLAEAVRRARETEQRSRLLFGPDHPLVAAAMVAAAAVWRAIGERRTARRTDEAAVVMLGNALGRDHPCSLVAVHNLAIDLALSGDTYAAIERVEDVLRRAETAEISKHPDFVASAINFARLRMRAGDTAGAPNELIDHLAAYRSMVGSAHSGLSDADQGRLVELDIEFPPN